MAEQEVKQPVVKETIPLWLAVAITVVVSLPFGLWLGKWNLALWCSFIVWAEYFNLGAKPDAFRLILPAFAYGTLLTAACMFVMVLLIPLLPTLVAGPDLAAAVALFIFVGFIVYSMKWSETLQKGSLPLFNGISMLLALYFTNAYPATGNAMVDPWMAGLWTILSGWFGACLGWFNIYILFPRKVS
jgi:hypothetical protein